MRTLPDFADHRNGHSVVPAALLPIVPAHTEAPCSVNGYFKVEGYADRFQATGRGATASEAARNLQATIAETRLALEAPAPAPPVPSREERLAALLACGLKKATAQANWGLIERLSKAAALVLSGAVMPGEREGLLTVASSTQVSTWYEVEHGKTCSCPDFARKSRTTEGQYRCKHLLASLLYARLEE